MQILEHIHVNVDSIAKTAEFLRLAVPDFPYRGGGEAGVMVPGLILVVTTPI